MNYAKVKLQLENCLNLVHSPLNEWTMLIVFINCLVHKDVPVSSLKENYKAFLKDRQICLLRKYICMLKSSIFPLNKCLTVLFIFI